MSAAEVNTRTTHSADFPCPVCDASCYGSTDVAAQSTVCTTETARGELAANSQNVWMHIVNGDECACGETHTFAVDNVTEIPPGRAVDLPLRFSIGHDVKPSKGAPHDHKPASMTFGEFAARLADPSVGPKGSAGFYLPAVFEPGKRGKGDAVEPPCLVSVDLDFGDWTIESIHEVLPDETAWVAYSTASHTLESPRYRVVLPLSEPLDVDQWTLVSRGVMRLFGYEEGNRAFDRCTEKISQPMFLPTITTPESPFEFDSDLDAPAMSAEMIERIVKDERDRERAIEEESRIERERCRERRPISDTDRESVIDAFNAVHSIEEMLERAGYAPPRVSGGRWLSPNSSAGKPAVKVWSDEGRFYSHHASDQGTEFEQGDAFDLFRLYEHDGDWKAAVKAAALELDMGNRPEKPGSGSTTLRGEAPPPGPANRPTILVNGREARDVISDIVSAVANANEPPTLFSRIGRVVRVVRNDLDVGEARPVAAADQLNVVSEAADFVRFDARSRTDVTTHPKKEIYAGAFAQLDHSDDLPRLRLITPTPIIHEDGRIVDTEGYDPKKAAYYAPAPGFRLGHVPDKPTHDDAQRAVEIMMRPFRDLPFATDTDRANFLAALVTVVTRLWFRTVPFVVLEAPIQGSGKTLAAMAVRVVAEGNAGVGLAPESGNQGESEWRKRITSVLLAGPSVSIFDNVTGTLGGPTLAALSTSPVFSDRILKTNDAPDLPNLTTWIFTSNNAQVDADLLRRCLFVRLDPRDAAPHLRDGFEIPDLIPHLESHRGDILAAIYTIVRYWIAQDNPDAPSGTPVLGSFEKWSRVVPAILGAVGVTGVLGDIDERNALMRDPDEEDAADFLEAWWTKHPELRESVAAKELIEAAIAGGAPGRPELPLPSALANGRTADVKPAVLSRGLGKWLKFRRDRRIRAADGETYVVRLEGGSGKRGYRWSVDQVRDGGES